MVKQDIVDNISENLGIDSDDIKVVIDNFMKEFKDGISRGENIYLRGLGSFTLKDTKPKKRFNINKGENILIPTKKTINFKPSIEIAKKVKLL